MGPSTGRSCREPPAALDDQTLWAYLQEQHDQQEDPCLGNARRRALLDERVRHSERQRREHRPTQLTEAADDDDEEGIDDVPETERRPNGAQKRDAHAREA